MSDLKHLLANNRRWAESIKEKDAEYFDKLAEPQCPEYLWIGCSDSRVPSGEILSLSAGQIFVHRNVANVVCHTDLNFLAVLQFAVDILKVKHIIVCGHYGCGGIMTAMQNQELGLIDNWLINIKDVYRQNQDKLDAVEGEQDRIDLLCELNVRQQVKNVCFTTIVQNAWMRGQEINVHGWIFAIKSGLLNDLEVSVGGLSQVESIYRWTADNK